jgi:hypothetical protein
MITKPQLPPKAGYVEIIDSMGKHIYQPTAETQKRLTGEAQATQLLQQDITDLQLADIEQEQEITELQLTILEGQA